MKSTEELTGLMVLVHPELDQDSGGKKSEIGTITFADLANDHIYVSFGQEASALYSAGALLILKPAKDVYQNLMSNRGTLTQADYKALYQIGLLLEYGTAANTRAAIGLARQSETARHLGMETLKEALACRQTVIRER